MSKKAFFKRYLWLFDLIKNNRYLTYEEIEDRFNHSDFQGDSEAGFSKRTFHRDQQEILELFGIEIKYSKIEKGYFIEDDSLSTNAELLIDSYRIVSIFQTHNSFEGLITSEPRSSGSEHLQVVLDAIQKRKRLEFLYQRYVSEVPEKRTIEPFFLKEFKARWYVVARDRKDLKIKTFALERIITEPLALDGGGNYDIPLHITADTYFKDSFGIFKMENLKAEEVILSFTPMKGMFLKSQPLHHSQEILVDNKTEFRIKLCLQITHDFEMEILSHGNEVKVISPESLVQSITWNLQNAWNNY